MINNVFKCADQELVSMETFPYNIICLPVGNEELCVRRTKRCASNERSVSLTWRCRMESIYFGQILDGLISGETADMDAETLRKLFSTEKTVGATDDATKRAALQFALDHECNFCLDERTGKGIFSKK